MKISIYKLSFSVEIPYLDEIYEYLSDIEKKKISSFNIISSFYYSIENKYNGYFIIPVKDMEEYEFILKNNFIPYLCKDLGPLILDNEIDLEKELEYFIDMYNFREYEDFIYEMNHFIFSNLDLDSILDRIILHGVKSLRPIDKEFLRTV